MRIGSLDRRKSDLIVRAGALARAATALGLEVPTIEGRSSGERARFSRTFRDQEDRCIKVVLRPDGTTVH